MKSKINPYLIMAACMIILVFILSYTQMSFEKGVVAPGKVLTFRLKNYSTGEITFAGHLGTVEIEPVVKAYQTISDVISVNTVYMPSFISLALRRTTSALADVYSAIEKLLPENQEIKAAAGAVAA